MLQPCRSSARTSAPAQEVVLHIKIEFYDNIFTAGEIRDLISQIIAEAK
jgi:hypothetical protein